MTRLVSLMVHLASAAGDTRTLAMASVYIFVRIILATGKGRENERGERERERRWVIYIYIYAGELVLVPLFGLSRVSFGTTSRVRNSTTSWGAHFRTTKIGFFEDFCDKFWCQLVFLCFVFWAQLVSSHLLFSILQFFFLFGQRGPKILVFFWHCFSKKHYKNRVF